MGELTEIRSRVRNGPAFFQFTISIVNPHVCTGSVFDDVNSTAVGDAFCGYIEHFAALGITGGCNVTPPLYCPDNYVTRAQMAVFLTSALDTVSIPRTQYFVSFR